jgi:hypothetical protein
MLSQAIQSTCARIEELIGASHAFRKVDDCFYVVRQGSAYIHVHVVPWEEERALIRFIAQLARGVEMTPDLALKLLHINSRLRFGSFGWVRDGSCVTLQHTIPGGRALDGAAMLGTLRDLAVLADEYDDRIVNEAGGRTMQDLLEERELGALRESVFGEIDWEPVSTR